MGLTKPRAGQINFDATNITDPLIRINSGQSVANDKDAGWVVERGSDANVALIWDESADEFVLANTTENGTTSGNVTISSYAGLHVGSFIANGLTYPTSDGTNGQVLQTDGQGALSFADGGSGSSTGLASVQVFTSSGTWTRPASITKVIMEVQGAGGGGGNSLVSGDNNVHGAGGGYCKKFLDVSSISTSTITIGAGGTGTAYNVSAAGTDGGASSWADGTNTITGGGGDGGDISPAYVVSVGGTATGGDLNIVGQSAIVNAMSYAGNSVLGFGGTFRASTSAAGTQDGKGYGGGGTTWSGYATGGAGNGSGGIVIVWEYK